MKQQTFLTVLILAIARRGLSAPAQRSVISLVSPAVTRNSMPATVATTRYAVAPVVSRLSTLSSVAPETTLTAVRVDATSRISTSTSPELALATAPVDTFDPEYDFEYDFTDITSATSTMTTQRAHISTSLPSFSSSVQKQFKSTTTQLSTSGQTETPLSSTATSAESTTLSLTMIMPTPTLHMGPGLVRIPLTTSAQPPPSSAIQGDGPQVLEDTPLPSDDAATNDNPIPAPVHKLIILSMVFLGFIGLSCAFFLVAGSKRVRAILCRSCGERDDDEEDKEPMTQEKQVMTPPPSPPLPTLPQQQQSCPPPPPPPVQRTRWLKLPTQILQSSTYPFAQPTPSSAPPKTVKRKKVVDISANFPRSRFSDSSSEGSTSVYSTASSSSFDGVAYLADDTTTRPPRRQSDIEIVVTDTNGHLNSPEVNGERWSLEAQRQSTAADSLPPAADDTRWSIEPQRISTVEAEALAIPQRLREGIRWSLDPQRL